jgi:hypothetical protein
MESRQLAEACYHTFNTSVGQAFLSYLKSTYFDQRVYVPGMSFDHVSYLEGSRHVVDEILGLQRMYLTGEYPETSYEEDDGGADDYGKPDNVNTDTA